MYINEVFYQQHNISRPSLLFEQMTDRRYFAKDRQGYFVCVNSAFLKHRQLTVQHMGNKRDADLMPAHIVERIRQDDILVQEEKMVVNNQLEVITDRHGNYNWLQVSKSVLKNAQGNIVGIEGIIQELKLAGNKQLPENEFIDCIAYIERNLKQKISIGDLAARQNMSLSQFERKFKKQFNCTPIKFIKKIKNAYACQALQNGKNICDIVYDLGYPDQSYFSKEFKKANNISPKRYAGTLLNI